MKLRSRRGAILLVLVLFGVVAIFLLTRPAGAETCFDHRHDDIGTDQRDRRGADKRQAAQPREESPGCSRAEREQCGFEDDRPPEMSVRGAEGAAREELGTS